MLTQRSTNLFSKNVAKCLLHTSPGIKTIAGHDIVGPVYRGSDRKPEVSTLLFGLGSRMSAKLITPELLNFHVYKQTQLLSLTASLEVAKQYSSNETYSQNEQHKLNIKDASDREAFFQCLDTLGMAYGRESDAKQTGVVYIIDPTLIPLLVDIPATIPCDRTKFERELGTLAVPTFAIKAYMLSDGTLLDNPLYLEIDLEDSKRKAEADKFIHRWHELLKTATWDNLTGKEKEIQCYLKELMQFYGNPNLLEKSLPKDLIDFYNITGAKTPLELAQQQLIELNQKMTLKK